MNRMVMISRSQPLRSLGLRQQATFLKLSRTVLNRPFDGNQHGGYESLKARLEELEGRLRELQQMDRRGVDDSSSSSTTTSAGSFKTRFATIEAEMEALRKAAVTDGDGMHRQGGGSCSSRRGGCGGWTTNVYMMHPKGGQGVHHYHYRQREWSFLGLLVRAFVIYLLFVWLMTWAFRSTERLHRTIHNNESTTTTAAWHWTAAHPACEMRGVSPSKKAAAEGGSAATGVVVMDAS